MKEITIGGRKIPLLYTTYEMIAIQKEIGCTAFQLREEVFGIRMEDEDDPTSVMVEVATDPVKTEKFCKLVRILGNAGLEESGQEGDLTDTWIMRHMRPAMIMVYALDTMKEIAEGNQAEAPETEQGPKDLGLEEENAKKQPGN